MIQINLKSALLSVSLVLLVSTPKVQALEFYPYVDVTYWPPFDFNKALDNGIKDFTLAFVNSAGECSPRWGTYDAYTIDTSVLNIPEKIQNIKAHGGDVFISFGGASAGNNELSAVCETVEDLVNAYKEVIEKTGVYNLDFDVEGQNLQDLGRIEKRLMAIKVLQTMYPQLKVTFTLPVMPDGLTEDGLNLLRMALEQGVKFERVNIMAMDYGSAYPATEPGQMAYYAERAIESVNEQLKTLFTQYEIPFTGDLYDRIGVIPMIGRNDVLNEWFYPEDAEELRRYCLEKGVAMVSMWSLNRDKPLSEGESPDTQIYLSTKLPPDEYGNGTFVFAKILGGIQTTDNTTSESTENNTTSTTADNNPTSTTVVEPSENSTQSESVEETETTTEVAEDNITSQEDQNQPTPTAENSTSGQYSIQLVDSWEGGSQYRVEVNSTQWVMNITIADGEITSIWNAQVESQSGNTYTVIPASWFSGSFGFIVQGPQPVVRSVSFNGVEQTVETQADTSSLEWKVNITSDWDTGYVAQITLTNTGSEPITDWQLKMYLTSEITNYWGFVPQREDSTTVIIKPVDYTRVIPPGGEVQFGFVATKGGDIPYPQLQK